jgi:preprotein translocase subunit SecY
MIRAFQSILNIPDLRKRIGYTILFLVIFRLGAHIPVPGINTAVIKQMSETGGNTLFGLIDMFSGGAFKQLTVFALGIMPYISASIILQLLAVVVPYLERLSKEGEQGRKVITRYTRYGTILLTAFQAFGLAIFAENMGHGVVINPGISFRLMFMLTVTAGTAFLMWLGEQITQKGIGNGISLLIFAGIVARMPMAVQMMFQEIRLGQMNIFSVAVVIALFILVSAAVVVLTQGQRKLAIQHAQRVVGRKIVGGQGTYLPLKINHAGVIPIIFASSILLFPSTIASLVGGQNSAIAAFFRDFFNPYADRMSLWYLIVPDNYSTVKLLFVLKMLNPYNVMYVLLTVFFCYFYTAVTFNPVDVADNLKKYGAFVPGVRPGKPTSDLIDRILTRITLPGAIALALVAIIPEAVTIIMGTPYAISSFLGGTGLIIVVGVALDTMKQVESHLIMRHYEGFVPKRPLKGRGSW